MYTEEQLKELSHDELLAIAKQSRWGSLLSRRCTNEIIRRNKELKAMRREEVENTHSLEYRLGYVISYCEQTNRQLLANIIQETIQHIHNLEIEIEELKYQLEHGDEENDDTLYPSIL